MFHYKLEGDRLDKLLLDLVLVATAECVVVNIATVNQAHTLCHSHKSLYKWEHRTAVKTYLIGSFPCIFNQISHCGNSYLIRNLILFDIAIYGAGNIHLVFTVLWMFDPTCI